MTMLEVLKTRLIDGLAIVSVKEKNSNYKIEFEFEGDKDTASLPKQCAPGCQNEVADFAIKTFMASHYFKIGELVKAKEWMHK